MIRKQQKLRRIAMAAGWCWSVTALGSETPRVLPEIVVTPLRQPTEVGRAPYASIAIALRDPGASALARSAPEIVAEAPSAMAQKTAHGQGSPFLRGFTGFRTLLLTDGIRLNNSAFREGPNQYLATVDAAALERLEVALGPASVLYGSDAIGGAVNALSARPPVGATAALGGRTAYRYSTAEQSHGGRLEVWGRANERWGWIGGFSARQFGDLRGGGAVGRQRKTGYDESAGDFRVEWTPEENLRWTLAHQSARQNDVWRTHRTVYGLAWKGLQRGDEREHVFDQARDLTYARVERESADGSETLTLYRHAQSEDLRRVAADRARRAEGFEVAAWGANAQAIRRGDLGEWTLGADYQLDFVDSYGRRYDSEGRLKKTEIQGPVADDARYHLAGLYAQNRFAPSSAGGAELVGGARYTFARAEADRVKDPIGGGGMSLSEEWHNVVGSLRALQPLGSEGRSSVYAGVSQGFRAPNLSDLTRFDIARSGELETPSPDLNPEKYVSAEIGARLNVAPLRMEVCAYRTWIDGMIVRTPTGREIEGGLIEVVKKNAGDGYIHGVEGRADVQLSDEWNLWAQAAWMEGEVDGYPDSTAVKRREPVSRLLPTTVRTGLKWTSQNKRWWAELAGEAAEKADRLSAADRRDRQRIPPGGTPAYAVAHLRGGAQVTETLRLAAALENLADADYRIHGSGVNEPGRNFALSAELRF